MHDDDITPAMHTVGGSEELTAEDVREYLAGAGYAGEADAMIADCLQFPEVYRYSADRHRCIVRHVMRGAYWLAADCTDGEERIKALAACRRPLVPLGSLAVKDGRLWDSHVRP